MKRWHVIQWTMLVALSLAMPAPGDDADDPYGMPPREVRLERLHARPREFYAHYMACFPAGRGAIQSHRREARDVGGEARHYNLTPYARDLTPLESADLEIRRAMRIGPATSRSASRSDPAAAGYGG